MAEVRVRFMSVYWEQRNTWTAWLSVRCY